MNRNFLSSPVIILVFFSILVVGPVHGTGATYPLKKIPPKGFQTYQGILDWTPVSSTQAIAFARNRFTNVLDSNLRSFSLGKTGSTSSSRIIASDMGWARAAACLWIDNSGAASRQPSAPYGLLFVLFENSGTTTDSASVQVARFNSAGALTSEWKEIFTLTTSAGWYITDEALFASNRGGSIGVVPSLALGQSSSKGGYDSRVYFLECNLQDGGLIGSVARLALPSDGKDVYGIGFSPLWNGSSWLVPVTASLYKPATGWLNVRENRALVYSVSGSPAHKAALKQIGKDAADSPHTFSELVLTPYPDSSTDTLLFVRHRTLIPESRQRLDMFTYDYSIKRLNKHGGTLKSLPVAIPVPAHKIIYDPDSKLQWEDDFWSSCVATGQTLLLSQAHTVEFYAQSGGSNLYEQAVGFYAINATTGEVELRAQAINLWSEVELFRPLLHEFPGSSIGVINCAYHTPSPYPWDNYLSLFAIGDAESKGTNLPER